MSARADGAMSARADADVATVHLIATTRALLEAQRAAPLAPFLAEWPTTTAWRDVQSASRPALRWLTRAAAAAPTFSAALAGALRQAAPLLEWQQSYGRSEVDVAFLENYAWCELIGLHGPMPSERLACGFLLLGPATHYPPHRHEAEEIYLPLAGTADWQRGGGAWTRRAPGTLIGHARDESHAMRTEGEPLLALYLWRSANLAQRARLEAAPDELMARR